MIALFKKEISVFFSNPTGYLIITIFLLINSIILWYWSSQFNIIENGYANMDMLFIISPMLFLLFIPAVSMHVFAKEYSDGTIEVLITKPLSAIQIVFAKYIAVLSLICFSVFPTIIYVITIYYLGEIAGNLDSASILGSYLGLILLSSVFSSISVFSSALSSNQIVSLILSIILCMFFYYGFDLLSKVPLFHHIDFFIQKIGISYHYQNLSKGLIRFTDVIYFLSVTFLFLKLNEKLIVNKRQS